ncbi:unnamed protein product, partial [Polarella glacialis]
ELTTSVPSSSSSAPLAGSSSGAALVERTLQELSEQDDHRHVRQAEWDPDLVQLSTAVKTRIPQLVEERCRSARHRVNCGLIAQARHAWASADSVLYIWDYHREDPQVLVVPADSAIVSVAVCPARQGVFDSNVQWLLVLCTRLTVSLVGLQLDKSAGGLYRQPLQRPWEASVG